MDEDAYHLYLGDPGGYCSQCGDNDTYNHVTCYNCDGIYDLSFLPVPFDFDVRGDGSLQYICEECYKVSEAQTIEYLEKIA